MSSFYESHGIPVCPDGDKLRSDEEGLFCMIEGDRAAAKLVNGAVVIEAAKPSKAKSSKDKSEGLTDGNG